MSRKGWGFLFFILTVLAAVSPLWADGADDYYRSANKFYADKDYQHALDAYEGAIPYDADPYRAYIGMGNSEYSLNHKSKSLEYYQKSLAIHPDNPFLIQFVKKVKTEVA